VPDRPPRPVRAGRPLGPHADRLAGVLRHPVSQNALALYAYQAAVTLLPLITLPYLARVLGPAELGRVVLVQSFSWVLGHLVHYGFDLSGPRALARRRGDRAAMARTVADVTGAKLVLAAGCGVLSLSALLVVPQFRAEPTLVAWGCALAVLHGLRPGWFFLGIERMRPVAAIDLAILVLSAGALVALVRDAGDGWVVLAIWTTGAAAGVLANGALMYRLVPAVRPRAVEVAAHLRESWNLFVATGAASLYTTANVFLLSLVAPAAAVGQFAAAERVTRAASRFVPPIATAVFPRVTWLLSTGAEARARRLAVIALGVLVALGVGLAALLAAFAEPIVTVVFGPGYEPAVPVLRILALLLPLVAITTALGQHWLIARGLDRSVTLVTLAAGALNVVLVLVLVPSVGLTGMAWQLVGIELLLAAGMAAALRPTGARRRGRSRSAGSRSAWGQ
jgi:polysaccharide transporter, PST family